VTGQRHGDPRRGIPRTDTLLADPQIASYAAALGAPRVRAVIDAVTAAARAGAVAPDAVAEEVRARLARWAASATTLVPVLNATGVVVHTNLGRAPLTPAAREALVAAAGYVDVEFSLESGLRAGRGRGTLAALRERVPGVQAALVVNNGAAALSLAVTTCAQGRELIVSRGELVEIGDGFRLPDLIRSTGVVIREVGTTNRTHPGDYEEAIGAQTGAVLKVHPSNFVVRGFTAEVSVSAASRIARAHGVPLIVDTGSGLLEPDPLLPDEPDAATALAEGADLVVCSGDKMLGGPQAGIVLGRADLVEAMRRHPLARAFRADKLTHAALEATLRGPRGLVSDYLHAPTEELRGRTEALAQRLRAARPDLMTDSRVVAVAGAVGGGGGAEVPLPGWALALPEALALVLRAGRPAVVARQEGGRTLVDLRCIPVADEADLAEALLAGLERLAAEGN